ncbi:nitrate reductase cytochrome c-type subunit [Thiolapillus sp.]
MKKIIHITLVSFGLLLITGTTVTAKEDIASLRGTADLSGASLKPVKQKVISQEGGFERSYKLQPPMVPHKVDKYKITLKNNGCMKCHSKKNHKKEKSPMVGESHFLSRDGKKLQKVSARRYFCNQCHTVQIDATPLVKNEFDGLK